MRCVQISASDNRMDCRDMFDDPINPLPRKCATCGFPDLDFIPQPYFLVRSRTMSPNELALGENGNFFVRDRIRRVLELLAPGQCIYYPTSFKGTSETSPWFLAVQSHQAVTAIVKPSIPRCEACCEPRFAHPGTHWCEFEDWTGNSDCEVLKSATWGSSERGWDLWICRELFLSIRMLHLFKKIKAKGFYEATCQKPVAPNKEESAWIKEKILLLEASGIPSHAAGTVSNQDAKWFQDYLKPHHREVQVDWDIKAIEKQFKTKLPKSYVDFVRSVGPMSFENVDEQEGFTATIRSPDELGVEGYADEFDDEESKAVNGLTFATTDHGDCFCFDVQKDKKEFAVVLYKHEENFFEPYAENFAACIKRFAVGTIR